MPYKFLKHTADLRMEIKGRTTEELFKEALSGMIAVLKAPGIKYQVSSVKRSVKVRSADKTALLVDFLNEALAQAQINKEIYTGVSFVKFSEHELEAELVGAPVESFAEDIKAVTYHEADVKENEKGEWEATLILDI